MHLANAGVAARHEFEMIAHGRLGAVGIAGRDRIEDRPMGLVGNQIDARRQRRLALFEQPFGESRVNSGENRIARNERQDVVESDIRALETGKIAYRFAIVLQRRLEIGKILFRRMDGGVARQPGFEKDAHVSGNCGRRRAASMCRAVTDRPSTTDRGVGRVTRARVPDRSSTRPSFCRWNSASRIAGRPTPKVSINSRSEGSGSLGA